MKKLNNNIFECRCICGNLIKVNGSDLINKKIKRCEECDKRIIIRNTKTVPTRLLCYIWEMYLYKYNNPDSKFKKEIIKKNIQFFPELFEYDNPFLVFSQWALSHNFTYITNNIYLDRKDKNKNFSMDNCYWVNQYNDNGTMIYINK